MGYEQNTHDMETNLELIIGSLRLLFLFFYG
jgi:hypothetical protein